MTGIEPVKKQVVVNASQARTFDVFGEGMHRWWPPEHHIGQSPLKKMIVEPRVGGRWYAECVDGSECDTGKVLVWDPPRRMVLAWQINAQWQYDAGFVTEIEVTFTAEAPERTRVNLEHRKLAAYGVAAAQTRTSLDAPGGWTMSLALFAKSAEAA